MQGAPGVAGDRADRFRAQTVTSVEARIGPGERAVLGDVLRRDGADLPRDVDRADQAVEHRGAEPPTTSALRNRSMNRSGRSVIG